jgi:hypothetical protein
MANLGVEYPKSQIATNENEQCNQINSHKTDQDLSLAFIDTSRPNCLTYARSLQHSLRSQSHTAKLYGAFESHGSV